MIKNIQLKKSVYHSAKVAVHQSTLYSKDVFNKLQTLSFEEILKYLAEHGFRKSIDKSYSRYEGFYLIEKFLNDHIGEIYERIINSAPGNNRVLYDLYYLKFQIYNLMVLVRCKNSEENNISPYLIGDKRKRDKFVKAFAMKDMEDALKYIASKTGFDSTEIINMYKQGLFQLENYLYKEYYRKLSSVNFIYNNKDERGFRGYIKVYVDLINTRSLLRLKAENSLNLDLKYLFLEGGNLKFKYFQKLDSKEMKDIIEELSKYFSSKHDYSEFTDIINLDRNITNHEERSESYFIKIPFGSPFYAFKYLFTLESQISRLRVLLKAKYLKLPQEEIRELM